MVLKGQMKSTKWISAYENNNVDVGLECSFQGKAQIGKGILGVPDLLKEMMEQKISHPMSGANCAWYLRQQLQLFMFCIITMLTCSISIRKLKKEKCKTK